MNYFIYPFSISSISLNKIDLLKWKVIAPAKLKEQYANEKKFYSLKNIIFVNDFNPTEIFKILLLEKKITKIVTLSEPDMIWVGLFDSFFTKKNNSYLINTFLKDKYWMRLLMLACGIDQPDFKYVRNLNDITDFLKIHNQCVIKPRLNDSADGIKIINSNTSLIELQKYSNNSYIIEEKISNSRVITADGYYIDGKIGRLLCHEYSDTVLDSLEKNSALITRTSTLYKNISKLKQLKQIVTKIINYISTDERITPFHFEFFYNGEFKFIEVGKRFGGGGIMKLGIQEFGIDLLSEYWSIENGNTDDTEKVDMPLFPKTISAWYKKYTPEITVTKNISFPSENWILEIINKSKLNVPVSQANNISEILFAIHFDSINEEEFQSHVEKLKKINIQ